MGYWRGHGVELQKRLHCVHKEFFPLPAAAPTMPASYAAALTRLEHSGVNQAPGHHLLKYHLRPIRKQGLDAESTPTVTSFEAVRSKLKQEQPEVFEVHGPPGLSKLEAAMRRHQCKDRNIDVEYREIESDAASGHATPVFEDPLVTISPVMIQPGGAVEEATPPEPRGDRPPKSGRAVASRAGSGDVGTGVCYLVELSEVPGKFDTVKAEELGLPPRSPQRDQLCRGQTVVNSEGVEVKPRDVMGPPTPGPVVLVVDCPTPRCDPIGPADGEGRRDIRGDERGREERTLTCVVHLSPAEVVALPEYTAWMASCRGSPQHLLVNAASCNYSPAPSAFSDNLQGTVLGLNEMTKSKETLTLKAAREANVLILEATANASSEETAQCERQYGATRYGSPLRHLRIGPPASETMHLAIG
eukprot:gene6043-7261_t